MKEFIANHISLVIGSITTILVMALVIVLIVGAPTNVKSTPEDFRFEIVCEQQLYNGCYLHVIRDKQTDKEYLTNGQWITPLGTFNHKGE